MDRLLDGIPLVDNHCHGLRLQQDPGSKEAWRRLFTESYAPAMAADHVPQTLFFHRLIREMADHFGCDATEDAVLTARSSRSGEELIREFLGDAGLSALLVDQGFPPPSELHPDQDVTTLTGVATYPLLRIELRMQEFILEEPTLARVEERLEDEVQDVRARGFVALKSIVAYRTGLEIREWPEDEVLSSFTAAKAEGSARGTLRLAHKPLLDHLLVIALRHAAKQELPVQFHTGYGDTDTDLRLGNPLHLRWLLEHPDLQGLRVVLLHESYPFTRQSGFLSAVYEHVYSDLSYGIPFLSLPEMTALTREAMGVAPLSKLLYSSDAVGIPELHWVSARHGRQAIGAALEESVRAGELSLAEAISLGTMILGGNAKRLYGLK